MALSQIEDIQQHFTNTINTLKHINIQPIQHAHLNKIKKHTIKGLLLIKQRAEKTHNNIVSLIQDLEKIHNKLLIEFKQLGVYHYSYNIYNKELETQINQINNLNNNNNNNNNNTNTTTTVTSSLPPFEYLLSSTTNNNYNNTSSTSSSSSSLPTDPIQVADRIVNEVFDQQ